MSVELDHVFVCAAVGAPEADALVAAGLTEGASNVHPGQGTACRRFFFRNAYLELLWVHSEAEARSPATAPTRLWQRWRARADGRTCPFGVCLRAPQGEPPPFPSWSYRPQYLPAGMAIPVATNVDAPHEPMLFVVPSAQRPDAAPAERTQPLAHANGLRELTRVSLAGAFEAPSEPLAAVARAGLVELRAAMEPGLVLGFDGEQAGKVLDLRPALPVVLRW